MPHASKQSTYVDLADLAYMAYKAGINEDQFEQICSTHTNDKAFIDMDAVERAVEKFAKKP